MIVSILRYYAFELSEYSFGSSVAIVDPVEANEVQR